MGFYETDPETGEEIFVPDPDLDWGGGDEVEIGLGEGGAGSLVDLIDELTETTDWENPTDVVDGFDNSNGLPWLTDGDDQTGIDQTGVGQTGIDQAGIDQAGIDQAGTDATDEMAVDETGQA